MTILYDAGELGVFYTLFKWKGTMFPLVMSRPLFWILMLIHGGLLLTDNLMHVKLNTDGNITMLADGYGVLQPVFVRTYPLPKLNFPAVGTITGLLTFFIVFYSGQSYARLTTLYGHCVGLGGTTMNWVGLVKLHFPRDKNTQWNAARLILAAMHILYYTLNESDGGAAISDEEWAIINKRNLLKKNEIGAIAAYGGYKPFLPLVWALGEVEDALNPPQRLYVSDLLSNFRELAFAFRGHCGQITNALKQPVPFPYFHALTMLLVVDLLLVSYGLVTLGFEVGLTATIYVVICIMFIGLKDVAVAMSDPFGTDDVDFDLEPMLAGAYKNAVALLRDERVSDGDDIGELLNPVTDRTQRFTITQGSSSSSVKAPPSTVNVTIQSESQRRKLLPQDGAQVVSERI